MKALLHFSTCQAFQTQIRVIHPLVRSVDPINVTEIRLLPQVSLVYQVLHRRLQRLMEHGNLQSFLPLMFFSQQLVHLRLPPYRQIKPIIQTFGQVKVVLGLVMTINERAHLAYPKCPKKISFFLLVDLQLIFLSQNLPKTPYTLRKVTTTIQEAYGLLRIFSRRIRGKTHFQKGRYQKNQATNLSCSMKGQEH